MKLHRKRRKNIGAVVVRGRAVQQSAGGQVGRRRFHRVVKRRLADAVRIEAELQRRKLLEALARRRGEGIIGIDVGEQDVAPVGEDVERVRAAVLRQVCRRIDLRQRMQARIMGEAAEELDVGDVLDVDDAAEAAGQVLLRMLIVVAPFVAAGLVIVNDIRAQVAVLHIRRRTVADIDAGAVVGPRLADGRDRLGLPRLAPQRVIGEAGDVAVLVRRGGDGAVAVVRL